MPSRVSHNPYATPTPEIKDITTQGEVHGIMCFTNTWDFPCYPKSDNYTVSTLQAEELPVDKQ